MHPKTIFLPTTKLSMFEIMGKNLNNLIFNGDIAAPGRNFTLNARFPMHLAVLRMTSKLSTANVYKNSTAGDTDMKPVPNESWTFILLHAHAFLFLLSIC